MVSQLQQEYGERDISMQYAQLGYAENCPEGIYVQLDDDETHLWHSVIFVQGGPFSGGIFRFDIVFPPNYPLATPQVFFPPTLLHPLVEPNSGKLSLSTRFAYAWKPRSNFASHILYFVRDVFKPETLDQLTEGVVSNREVYRMYRNHRVLFNKLALQSVALSSSPSSLYDHTGGSGFPNPSIGLHESNDNADSQTPKEAMYGKPEEANGILFRELNQKEMAQLRQEIFGPL